MYFEQAREKDLYLKDKEKATRLTDVIVCMLKAEHISISETRNLFRNIVENSKIPLCNYLVISFSSNES